MFKHISIAVALCCGIGSAHAATFTDQTAFETALDSFTLIDTSDYIGDAVADIPLGDLGGATFFGAPSTVRSDDLILNGSGFFGASTPHVGLSFSTRVTGVGVTSNAIDGGRIQLWSGANGTGTLLGEGSFGGGASAQFGGLIIGEAAGSVVFTCDFNSDLKCGLRDIVFGSTPAPVPLPAGLPLLLGALGLLGWMRRST
ncbi:MAG: hypothetical protein AAF727_08460 [Pseudomonadota bacterium]